MSGYDQKDDATHGAQTRPNAPEPGSPLQPGADGNPQAMPVAKPDAVMPERQPVTPSKDHPADSKSAAAGETPHVTPASGNEDPGAEVEDLPPSAARAQR
ncbi:MAG: hypothetical protein EOO27_11040 [Comamonadaceae bacterium]|nr:MAG: hypothetical protein EOO27_11040 [Comamonadaceae bacterium]